MNITELAKFDPGAWSWAYISIKAAADKHWELAASSRNWMIGAMLLGGSAIVVETVFLFTLGISGGGRKSNPRSLRYFLNSFAGPVQLLTSIGTIMLMVIYGSEWFDNADIASTCTMATSKLMEAGIVPHSICKM
jgi:hypothetical protein